MVLVCQNILYALFVLQGSMARFCKWFVSLEECCRLILFSVWASILEKLINKGEYSRN
jgi:hypothetical protein